ncbi:MAG TPA: protein kinase, partial [Planctomycetia bacterium]|nr:protein kinase [Planctomycetia bacterium]
PAMVELEGAKADAGRELAVEVAETPSISRLGDFRLLREIGRGGMGVVYEAEQVSLGRRVAIKLLPASVFRDETKRRRFEREAKAAAKLHHSNIVPVHGFGEHDGTPYYVMQFIPGLGLDAVIHELARNTSGGREGKPPAPGGRPALSAVLARTLVHADGTAVTAGWIGPSGDDAAITTAGGNSADTGAISHAIGNSSASLSVSNVYLPGQSGSEIGAPGGRKSTYWQSVARIGVQVAGALAYAHRQGVLHRDIKPANLLLDLEGAVWVTDFGLAKADDSDNLTHTGDLLGTLRYMPPEAFEGKSDARSDVCALGLTLFEMVALRPAYDERDKNKLVKQVASGEPPRLRKVRRDAPRDLVTIVEKATEKDPARRYQSAGALADDLQRFLDGRPIAARRATEFEKLWMWARRRPAVAGLVVALFLCLLAGAVVSTVFAVRADRYAREAELREREATAARDAARRNAAAAETARDQAKNREGEAIAARDEEMRTRHAAARQSAALLLDRGIEDARAGEPARALHLFVRALKTLAADDPRTADLERVIRANLAAWAETVPALERVWNGGVWFEDIVFSPDGELIVLGVGKNEIQCFRTDSGRPFGPALKVTVGGGAPMVFSPDSRTLWIGSPGRWDFDSPGAVAGFNVADGRPVRKPIPTGGPVVRLFVTPDGRRLVGVISSLHPQDNGGRQDANRTHIWRTASIVAWDAATGAVIRKEDVDAVSEAATANNWPDAYVSLSPDGKLVNAWVERGSNRFESLAFALEPGEPVVRAKLPALGRGGAGKLHFENDMRTGLAIRDDLLHRWSAAKPDAFGPGIPTLFRSMLYGPSADGRSVISQGEARIFDTGAWPPRPSGVRFVHPGWSRSDGSYVDQSPDGRFAATSLWTHEGDRRLWRLPRSRSRPALPPAETAGQPVLADQYSNGLFQPGGKSVVLWSGYPSENRRFETVNDVRIVDVTTGAVRGTTLRHSHWVRETAFSPDGGYFATCSFDGSARVWETATGRPAGPVLKHSNYVSSVAFSPDGAVLAAGDYGRDGLIKFWDWRKGKEVRPPIRHDDIILSVAFSPDGKYIAAGKARDWSGKPEFLVWEIATAKTVIRREQSRPSFTYRESAQFRPDGRAVAIRDEIGVLRLWEMPSGKPLGEQLLDGDGVTRFSPDGRVVAAAANLGVRLFDGKTLDPLPGGYLPHLDPITDVAFSPDGAFLLVGYESGSAQLWDVSVRKPVGPPAVLMGPIRAVSFSPDGKTCLCVAADGAVRRWPAPLPFAEPDLARLADRVVLMTVQRMNDNQGLDTVPVDQWRALRSKLVGDGSTALMSPMPDASWHDDRAVDAEQDDDSYGAEWHLRKLAALRPDDWVVPARRARVLATAGRRDEAEAAYAAAKRLVGNPQALSDWLRSAAVRDEAVGRKDAALWNLNQALALTPEDWTLYVLRAGLVDPARADAELNEAIRRGAEPGVVVNTAALAAEDGKWKRAAALLDGLARNSAFSVEDRLLHAVANLKAGNAAGYRAACAGAAELLPPIGPKLFAREALLAARAFVIAPEAAKDWTKPLALTDHFMARLAAFEKANPDKREALRADRNLFMGVRGAVLFRAGRFAEATKTLREGIT